MTTSTARSASDPYATEERASAASTGSASALRIRSVTNAELRNGAPSSHRRARTRTASPSRAGPPRAGSGGMDTTRAKRSAGQCTMLRAVGAM
ncbi:hypothetical protein [Streptomyces qinglanensis]|uniref:hypothetical protein n=1 Tax=Streptomyces qinglanensis TaxID=943816 RepID=UPI0013A6D775|nr:hypothetical protein [Streptomyces qinglanensis]